MPPRVLDTVFHHRALAVPIDQARCENLAERGTLMETLNLFLVKLIFLDPAPHFARQVFGQHAPGL